MDLEKYWRVLATEPEAFVFLSHWDFYDNGWFSLYDGDYAMLYDECGNLFQSASFKSILTLTDGSVALCKEHRDGCQWSVYTKQKEKTASLDSDDIRIFSNGLALKETAQDETFIFHYKNAEQKVSLGFKVWNVVNGPDNLFAYEQGLKHNLSLWYICKFEDGKVIRLFEPFHAEKLFFFDNGSYAVHYKGIVRVYNRFNQQIFACNEKKTTFVKVGDTYFLAYNGMRYKGVYSAENGKLVLAVSTVDYLFANGTVYDQKNRLSLSLGNGERFHFFDIYDFQPFGKSGAFFMYQDYPFVIDTDLPLQELRQKAVSELQRASEHDLAYARYLTQLILLLC